MKHPILWPDDPAFTDDMDCLTKREYFAVAALQGLLANASVATVIRTGQTYSDAAVRHADNLIDALNKEITS